MKLRQVSIDSTDYIVFKVGDSMFGGTDRLAEIAWKDIYYCHSGDDKITAIESHDLTLTSESGREITYPSPNVVWYEKLQEDNS